MGGMRADFADAAGDEVTQDDGDPAEEEGDEEVVDEDEEDESNEDKKKSINKIQTIEKTLKN